ncbi:MAG: UDP-N-acetylmuramoyl-L-alanyl-D-glutamate--2,6-diaminopimelate ligase [Candidatus Omnitrophica bacterium]|nr:UDP-N-acetylmuramoyl-L-alanyl-D-glutamate--2,6-diaminopimelate ligase [Candidatus Omnitrophota bacterium]
MKLSRLVNALPGHRIIGPFVDFDVSGICSNSKDARDDCLFVAVKGSKADGGAFIGEAIGRGARAVVYQGIRNQRGAGVPGVVFVGVDDDRTAVAQLACTFYGNPSHKLQVTGVTGTNGKTTVTYLIEAILKECRAVPAVVGTINYRFKDTVRPAINTTPGPLQLQAMLGEMLSCGVSHCCMEVSSHALDQGRTDGINFRAGIFTNLTQDHLDYHKDMEGYFRAKAKLFAGLPADSVALINTDDPFGRRLIAMTGARVVTYGLENDADVIARDIRLGVSGTRFLLRASGTAERYAIRLIGRHNLYNVLAAYAWGRAVGFPTAAVRKALEGFAQVPGRLEPVATAKGFSVFVDYAHTEDALTNVLQALRQITRRRIIVVFGCGGDRDKSKRPKMGQAVTRLADFAIITSDNPRSEEPQDIIRDITRGLGGDNFCVIPERLDAIRKSLELAKTGDVVLVAGKGHEDYQIYGDRTVHFDDREAVRECLRSTSC